MNQYILNANNQHRERSTTRILIAHNHYQQPGGEDVVVAAEHQLLAAKGHNVLLATVQNAAIRGAWGAVKAAIDVTYSSWGREWLARYLRDFQPDVLHIHNFFPRLTPAVYDACMAVGVPVVQTLHNFRLMCASPYLYRENRVCEDCIGASPYRAVLHSCYRGSSLASLAVARMIDVHRRRDTWNTKVDRFIALTDFAKSRFVASGLRADKIVVKPNFVADPGPSIPAADALRSGALYVGRLSPEKGIGTMLDAWRSLDVSLVIVGDGPLRPMVEKQATGGRVRYLGQMPPEVVSKAMQAAAFLVMPSECYETFGLVIVEAFANGLPVIASRLGAMPELVDDGRSGLLCTPGDATDLARKIRWAATHPEEMRSMGRNARIMYERRYTPDQNYNQLLTVYESVIKNR